MESTDTKVKLEDINIYGGTQTRAFTNDEAVITYAEAMAGGAAFPPIIVFFDGSTYWLADGFHRYLAAKHNEVDEISCLIKEGGRTDALIFALGANSTNGLFRTADDKRAAVEIALEEWWDKSNSYLADVCKVSTDLIRRVRKASGREAPEMVTGKDGKQYPSKIEREPRGESESSEGGGGGGGKPSKKNMNVSDRSGGSHSEIEGEARKMIRDGEIDPRELRNLSSAEPTDYAHVALSFLDSIDIEHKKYGEAIEMIEKWVQKQTIGSGL